MKGKLVLLLAMAFFLCFIGSAQASYFIEEENFDKNWKMNDFGWTEDRRLPSTVTSSEFDGDYRLHFEIDSEDKNDTWRDYEGINRTVDNMPSWMHQSFSIDLYIGSDWDSTDRNAGLWARGEDANGGLTAWPILVYRNMEDVDSGFYTFNYLNGNAGWENYFTVGDLGTWYNLRFDLYQGQGVEYFVNNTSLGLFADEDTYRLSNVILNAYNFGDDQDIYYDNFKAVATPEPTTWLLFGTGLLGLLAVGRKKIFNRGLA